MVSTNARSHAPRALSYPCLLLVSRNHDPASPLAPGSVRSYRNRYLRQRFKDNLILLIMSHKPSLQHPPQRLQATQLPPPIDPHNAALMDPHHHSTPIPLSRLLADSILVPRPMRRVLYRV